MSHGRDASSSRNSRQFYPSSQDLLAHIKWWGHGRPEKCGGLLPPPPFGRLRSESQINSMFLDFSEKNIIFFVVFREKVGSCTTTTPLGKFYPSQEKRFWHTECALKKINNQITKKRIAFFTIGLPTFVQTAFSLCCAQNHRF